MPTKFGLDNPSLGATFETKTSKYEYKLKGGRLQPVRIGSPAPKSTPESNVIDTTQNVDVDPSKGGSKQTTYNAGSNTPNTIVSNPSSEYSDKTQITRATRDNNGVEEIYVNGKWIPRTPLSSSEAGFPDISNVSSINDANRILDQIQGVDFDNFEASDLPPDKTTLTDNIKNSLEYYSKVLAPETERKEFSAEDKLKELRDEFGIGSQEDELNTLKAEEEQILASLRARRNYQAGKPVALGVIEGRVNEIERQEMDRLDFITRQKQVVYDGLKTKYSAVQQIMDAAGLDYENAEKKYNNEFNRNLQVMSIIRGVEQDALTQEEKAKDNALASLQVMFNNIAEGGLKFSDLSSEQQIEWQKIETRAGLPTGTIQQVSDRNPEGKIISTSTRQSGSVKYFDAIMQLPDGTFKVETVKVGSAVTGSTTTQSNKVNNAIIKQRASVIAAEKTIDQAVTDLELEFGSMTSDQKAALKEKYFNDIE